MVLLALRRASLDWLLIDEFDRLSGQVYTYHQADDTADVSSRKRRLKEEHWTIQRDEEHDTIKIINDDTTNNSKSSSTAASNADMHTTQLIYTLQTIRHLTTKSLPELSSRIIHATSPILHELSRGYFVPFLTGALACLGRIHVLILRLGRELVGTLSQHVPKLRDCVTDGRKKGKGDGSLIKLKEALAPFINSTHTLKGGRELANEWNELMKPFTEIGHDEFTKNMSNFVKDRRWKDAITAFGIKKDDLIELQLLSQQTSDAYSKEDEDGKGDSMNLDDMGELVYVQQEHDDKKNDTKRSGTVDVDENMARVLDKRRIDETSSATAAKKKKRRRKKKKSVGDSEANETAADNAVKVADDAAAKAESKQSGDDNIKKIAEEDAKAASKQSNNELNSSTDVHLQNSRLSPKDSSNSGDEAMIDAQHRKVDAVTKKEKKSKKKKTKKKKSKNVIDDIFG